MAHNGYVRTSSGVWKVDDDAAPASRPPGRSSALAEQARAELARGNLSSAETSFRLALTFSPGNTELLLELQRVVEARSAARKAAGLAIR
jgi:Flp pilus assembly protein TadD